MASRTESFICPPQLNADVGGIGVRISFYLQALFLGNLLSNPLLLIRMHLNGIVAWLSARSASFKEKRSSLYALIATNIAMVVTTTILSFKPKPEVTLQEYVALLLQYSNLRFTESSNN